MMKYKTIFYCFFLVMFSLQSCRLFRQAVVIPQKDSITGKSFSLTDSITAKNLNLNSISGRFDLSTIINNQANDLNGQIKLRRDSFIWCSINALLGIEVARILLTPDSVKLINRIDGTYFTGNYDFIKKTYSLDIDFNVIQSIFLNEIFVYNGLPTNSLIQYPNLNETTSYVLSSCDDEIKRTFIAGVTNQIYQSIFVNQNFKVSNVYIKDYLNDRHLSVVYADFKPLLNNFFPEMLKLIIADKKSTIEFSVNFKKLQFNEKIKYNFTIPEKYKKMYDE